MSLPLESRRVGSSIATSSSSPTIDVLRATIGVWAWRRIDMGFERSVDESRTTKLFELFKFTPSTLARFACDWTVAEKRTLSS